MAGDREPRQSMEVKPSPVPAPEVPNLTAHLTGTELCVASVWIADMQRQTGSVVTHILTKSMAQEGKVQVKPCPKGTPGARPLRPSGARGTAFVDFGLPLKKLGIQLPSSRRLILNVNPVAGKEAVYEISFADFTNQKA